MRSAPGRSASGRRRSTEPPLGAPILVLNLKTYPDVLGASAVRIARSLHRAGLEAGVAVAIAPALPDLARVASEVPLSVLAQHVDPVDAGACTGSVPPAAVAASGASGSLVNHSEHPVSSPAVGEAVRRLEALGLVALVCARDTRRAAELAHYRPAYLAVEPPELIGGRRAVSTARPGLVSETVRAVRAVAPGTRVLCGAGVHSRVDVVKALALGSEGILVASAVTRARHPERAIEDLLSGF